MKIVNSTEEFKELVVKGNVIVDFYADYLFSLIYLTQAKPAKAPS